MSSILDSVVPTSAPSIASFGAGGQMYIADMFTGFNVSAERTNQLFAFAETDNSVPNAEFLTNLTEARKIGSTMDFKALQIGLRVVPTGADPLTAAQVAAAKSLLASAKVKITLGSNQTIVGEFSGFHMLAPVDFLSLESSASSQQTNGAIGNTAWINLKEPIGIQANCNVGGSVHFAKAVPAALTATANSFAFVVVLSGLKVVKS
jgi:hypothetical protein